MCAVSFGKFQLSGSQDIEASGPPHANLVAGVRNDLAKEYLMLTALRQECLQVNIIHRPAETAAGASTRRTHYGFSTIFQLESLRTTFPSRNS